MSCNNDCNCGSCADSCNSCNGPKVIITKQGLKGDTGPEGPINPNDRFSYNATSSSTINLDALFITPVNIAITIELNKAFLPGDFIRISDIPGAGISSPLTNYIEGLVVSYDSTTGALVVDGATNFASVNATFPYRKMVGTGTINVWYISLIDPRSINVSPESTLVYHAIRDFTNAGITYLETTSGDIADPAEYAINRLVFNSADPDVTVVLNTQNSHFKILDETLGLYDGLNVKAIIVNIAVTHTGGDNDWITPVNISGTDVYRTGSLAIIKHADIASYTGAPIGSEIKTLTSIPLGENSNTVSIEGTHRNFEKQANGPYVGYFFKYMNDSDLPIIGGVSGVIDGAKLGFYSIKVFI